MGEGKGTVRSGRCDLDPRKYHLPNKFRSQPGIHSVQLINKYVRFWENTPCKICPNLVQGAWQEYKYVLLALTIIMGMLHTLIPNEIFPCDFSAMFKLGCCKSDVPCLLESRNAETRSPDPCAAKPSKVGVGKPPLGWPKQVQS